MGGYISAAVFFAVQIAAFIDYAHDYSPLPISWCDCAISDAAKMRQPALATLGAQRSQHPRP
jgi:hypothetical protein